MVLEIPATAGCQLHQNYPTISPEQNGSSPTHLYNQLPLTEGHVFRLGNNTRNNERYDIYSLEDGERRLDEVGILKSVASIKEIVDGEVKAGIPLDRIVIGGFSQGGAVALLYSCFTEEKMAGFIGMSAYLPLEDKVGDFLEKAGKANVTKPVLMCHGRSVRNYSPDIRVGRRG
jgi:predicted esterase